MNEKYIFYHDALIQFGLSTVIACLPLYAAIYNFYKIWLKQHYFEPEEDKQHRLPIALVSLLLGIGIGYEAIADLNKAQRIKANFAQTLGETIVTTERTKANDYRFKFIANGKTYYGVERSGETIVPIKRKGGRYIVVYNSKDPSDNIMDFDSGMEVKDKD